MHTLLDLVDDMYSFIGLNAIKLMEEDKVTQLPYNVLKELVSGEYYIDLPEEMVLGLVVDWANHDFQVCIVLVSSIASDRSYVGMKILSLVCHTLKNQTTAKPC